jgi:hypothetical protein
MYMVISKPRRISVAAGFSHFIRLLLSIDPAQRGKCTKQHICPVRFAVCSFAGFAASSIYGFTPHDFHEITHGLMRYKLYALESG